MMHMVIVRELTANSKFCESSAATRYAPASRIIVRHPRKFAKERLHRHPAASTWRFTSTPEMHSLIAVSL